MKKLIIIFALLAAALSFSACQQVEAEKVVATVAPTAADAVPAMAEPAATSAPFELTVNSGDAWGDYGYVHFLCEADGTYSFTAQDSDGIEWKVYLLDKEFDDAERFIPQAYPLILEGDGWVSINAGQYVYIYCSANCWTGIEARDEAKLECRQCVG